MIETLVDSFDIWGTAQTQKSLGKKTGIDNISWHGINRLRELILELAVRGKLVAQVSGDEPASLLLKKIEDEKKVLIKNGKIKEQQNLSIISKDEKSFLLPKGWEWVRLGNVINFINGFAFKSQDFIDEGIGIVKIGDIQNGQIVTDTMSRVSPDVINGIDDSLQIKKDELVIAMSGATTGKLGFNRTDEIFYLNQRVGKIEPFVLSIDYLYFPLTTKIAENLAKSMGSAIPNLSTSQIKDIVFALPPLEEQLRIVAKVEELMALCDKLEQQQMNHIETHLKLVEVLLQTLTNATNAKELKAAWQHLEPHFDILFTTEESIDLLKQTILQLAVMGKLVPQDKNDEPASELLKKIEAEKNKLIKAGKLKKQNPLPEITEDEKPFELPDGWEWCRLGDVSVLKGGFAYKSTKFIKRGNNQVIRMGNIRPDFLRLDENPVFISNELADQTAEYKIELDDILLTMTGTKGKRDYLYSLLINSEHIENKNLYLNQRLCIVRTFLFKKFLNQVIKNDLFLNLIYSKSTGTANQANIGMAAISDWLITIPPINEQKRIVSKIDELMTLCDQLKERIVASQQLKVKLADAVVEKAVS